MKIKAAEALASYVKEVDADHILPDALDKWVADVVCEAMA